MLSLRGVLKGRRSNLVVLEIWDCFISCPALRGKLLAMTQIPITYNLIPKRENEREQKNYS